MNQVLPKLAADEQLHSMLLTGYWVKIVDSTSYMDAGKTFLPLHLPRPPTPTLPLATTMC